LVVGWGVGLLWYTFPLLNLDLGRELLILAAFGMLAEWLAVVFPQGQLTGCFAVMLATYLIYGAVPAAWVSALAALLGQGVANRGRPLRTTLFNAAQYVPVILGSSFFYVLAGGASDRAVAWNNGWYLLLFILCFYLLHQLLIHFYTDPTRDELSAVRWQHRLVWDGLVYLLSVPLGLAMAWLYQGIGIYASLLLFVPMLAAQYVLRVYLQLAQAKRELQALYAVAWRLGGNLNLKDIFDLLLRDSRLIIKNEDGVIYRWSEEQDCYLAEATVGLHAELLQVSAVQRGEGFLGQAVESGECHLVDDTRDDERTVGDMGLIKLHRSLITVPLKADSEVLGLLVLGDRRTGFFEEKHVRLLTVLAGQAAVAMANLRLGRRLDQAIITDELTGLYHYRYFYHRAQGELEQARRSEEHLALLLLDIEGFQQVNNRYGLPAGDKVLAGVAAVLRQQVRDCDLVARYGNDEFVLLLPQTGPNEAKHVSDKLRLAVRDSVFEQGGNRIYARIRTSLANFPDGADDLDALFKSALEGLRGDKKEIKVLKKTKGAKQEKKRTRD